MINRANKKIILTFLIILAFILKADLVFALNVDYPDINIFGQHFHIDDTSTFDEFFCYFFGLIQNIAVFVVLIVIAFGGIYYLVDYGRGKFASEGKEWVKAGIAGFLIIVCSYLMIYTINPDIGVCRLGVLSAFSFGVSGGGGGTSNANITTYKEIPLGSLTEKLLTRTMHCYTFDQMGDPIWHPVQVASEGGGGNYKYEAEKDRVECIANLVDGAQKKAQVIAQLSDTLADMMNKHCDCNKKMNGQQICKNDAMCMLQSGGETAKEPQGSEVVCQIENGCHISGDENCYFNSTLTPDPNIVYDDPGNLDCCEQNSGVIDPNDSSKILSYKYILEHGPVGSSYDVDGNPLSTCALDGEGCCTQPWKIRYEDGAGNEQRIYYKGLDEFRCDPNKDCDETKEVCDPNTKKQLCSGILPAISAPVVIPGQPVGSEISEEAWHKLTLWQQMTFFKEEINNLKDTIYQDVGMLDNARNELSKCYLALPASDLIKNYESHKKEDRIVMKHQVYTDKITGDEKKYLDPMDGKEVDPTKYCLGFNYANSSCYKKCNDLCPDAGTAESPYIEQYAGCSDSESCFDIYMQRPCPYVDTDFGSYGTYSECISSCLSSCRENFNGSSCGSNPNADCIEGFNCKESCTQKYFPCSEEYQFCAKWQYENNSQCVLDPDNAGACLIDPSYFKGCSDSVTDQGNSEYCIKNAYWCKNGSNEYAGYPDCQDPYTIDANCSTFTDRSSCESAGSLDGQCVWDGEKCSRNYCASFLYYDNNPTAEKCPFPYEPAEGGRYCVSGGGFSCQEVCPETEKCPSSSMCPDCPCDFINETISFPVPDRSYPGLANYCILDNKCPEGENCSGNVCVGSNANGNTCTPECGWNGVCLNRACFDNYGNRMLDNEGNPVDCNPTCSSPKVCRYGFCVTMPSTIGNETYTSKDETINANVMAGPQCSEYSYNGDPLTFYCEDNYFDEDGIRFDPSYDPEIENKSEPAGEDRVCPKSGEIPVGQVVDGVKSWATTLIRYIDNIQNEDIQPTIDLMTKVGKTIEHQSNPKVQDYCKCQAELEDGSTLCKPDCEGTASDPIYEEWTTYECPAGYSTTDNPVQQTSSCIKSTYYTATSHYKCDGTCQPCNYNILTGYDPDGYPVCGSSRQCKGSCTPYNTTAPAGQTPPTCSACTPKTCGGPPCGSCYSSCTSSSQFIKNTCNSGDTLEGEQCRHDEIKSPLPFTNCMCNPPQCQGKPCDQEIDYLSRLWNTYKQFKEDYIEFNKYIIEEPRSDLIKQLTYARQTMNTCNQTTKTQGINTRAIDCSIIKDELIGPIIGSKLTKEQIKTLTHNNQIDLSGVTDLENHCYGEDLGKVILGTHACSNDSDCSSFGGVCDQDSGICKMDLTDNWFCCQQWNKNPTSPGNSPLNTEYDYDIQYNGL